MSRNRYTGPAIKRSSPEAAEYALASFSYDPATGVVNRAASDSPNATLGPVTRVNTNGYIVAKIGKVEHEAHRIAWLLTHGSWPARQIDHKNGIKTDNKLSNLREVDQSRNQWNGALRSDNTSGYKGVYPTRNGKFGARIKQFGKRIHLGTFETAIAAHEAYCAEARIRFGEHANSGQGPISGGKS